jgi:hypothetical protein
MAAKECFVTKSELHPKTAVTLLNKLNNEQIPEMDTNAEYDMYIFKLLEELEGNNDSDSIRKLLTM